MKKIFTLIMGLLATFEVVQAQTVEFRNNDQVIGNGETVTFYAEEDPFGEGVSINTNPTGGTDDLRLYNLTDHEINGNATITVQSNTLGSDEKQWCMGSACQAFSTDTYQKAYTIPAGGSIPVQFDIIPTQYGEMNSELSVKVGLVAAASITIRFVYSENAAVKGITGEERPEVVARYSIDGARLNGAHRGLNIVKLSDGRVIKIVED